MTNVLIFSGGRGSISLIASLKKIKKIKSISSIVNTYDDGKSSGVLRKEFNMPGPSDIRPGILRLGDGFILYAT